MRAARRSVMSFSVPLDTQLANLVSENPVLYDNRAPGYKDPFQRENIWREIAAKLNRSEEDCKKRWKSLRDSFIRCIHKQQKSKKRTTWALFEHLLFLNNVISMKPKDTFIKTEPCDGSNDASNHNDGPDDQNDSTNDGETSRTSATSLKRPNEEYIDEGGGVKEVEATGPRSVCKKYRESVDTFGEHVKAVLNTLPPTQFVWAKADIFNILTKYELENSGGTFEDGTGNNKN